ncbi:MAG: DUF3800 domain-containing protein [Candidatus Paceibacterota bacterium]|jgi:hypothetical protein
MTKIFIGVDESYDTKIGGIFVMCFLIIKNEKDLTYISSYIEKILNTKNIKEFKNKKIPNNIKKEFFSKFNKIDFIALFHKEIIYDNKDVTKSYYKNGLKLFSEYVIQNIKDFNLDIKIDKIEGQKLQQGSILYLNSIFKEAKIKHNVKYVRSESSTIIQCADIFAGEYRKNHKLGKNKYLL